MSGEADGELQRPQDKAEHARLSEIVRRMHIRLETAAAATSVAGVPGWKAAWSTVSNADSSAYADAMNKLFNVCWEGTTYVVDVMESYFIGAPVDDGRKRARSDDEATTKERGICGRAADFVKARRRAYFEIHGEQMPASEVKCLIAEGNGRFGLPSVRILDVGSCHGGLLRHAPAWMHVVPLDLQPAVPEVLQADWLDIPIGAAEVIESFSARDEGCQWGRVRGLRSASFDAVVMCFMLSFLPTPELRWEACRRAGEVLTAGGLLLILEPRRGAHSRKWHTAWCAELPNLGFALLRVQVMAKSISLLFSKAHGSSQCTTEAAAGKGLCF